MRQWRPRRISDSPSFSISGISTEPIAAVVAEEEPDTVANSNEVSTATAPRPPRIQPTKAFASCTSLVATPPEDMRCPARMKNGTAIRLNESRDWNAICATISSDRSPACKANAADMPSAVTMGAPMIRIAVNDKNRTGITAPLLHYFAWPRQLFPPRRPASILQRSAIP